MFGSGWEAARTSRSPRSLCAQLADLCSWVVRRVDQRGEALLRGRVPAVAALALALAPAHALVLTDLDAAANVELLDFPRVAALLVRRHLQPTRVGGRRRVSQDVWVDLLRRTADNCRLPGTESCRPETQTDFWWHRDPAVLQVGAGTVVFSIAPAVTVVPTVMTPTVVTPTVVAAVTSMMTATVVCIASRVFSCRVLFKPGSKRH